VQTQLSEFLALSQMIMQTPIDGLDKIIIDVHFNLLMGNCKESSTHTRKA
jgi:hypothetical protein